MRDQDNTDLLASWLEGTLTAQQREAFEARCAEDDDFARQVATANQTLMAAQSFEPEAVPDWARETSFTAPQRQRWWQWQGLPVASFATALLAVVLVLTGVRVEVSQGSMTIAFNDDRQQLQQQQQVEQLVSDKLAEFQQNQQLALTSYAQALQHQQAETSTQLTKYLLDSSRQERREDFAELVKFINQQRSDDQVFYARQLNKLQEKIYDTADAVNWSPAPSDRPINE